MSLTRKKSEPDFIMNWSGRGLMSVKMTQKKCLKFLARFYGITSKGESLYNQYLIDKEVVTVGDTISGNNDLLTGLLGPY